LNARPVPAVLRAGFFPFFPRLVVDSDVCLHQPRD
jgi:hypothetical protein